MTDDRALPHEREAEQAARTAEDLAGKSERLEREIERAREDWEAKKEDPAVPGAPNSDHRAKS